MPTTRRALLALAGGLPFAARALAGEADASAWAAAPGGAARLVARGGDDAMLLGAIQIRLERGTKTYWRSPGEAGVAPRFDWSGSVNLGAAEVLFPFPERFEEGGLGAIGYASDVTLPLRVTPADPARPVRLRLRFDYATCGTICVPASADLALRLPVPGGDETAHAPAIAAALARVPRIASSGFAQSVRVVGDEASVGLRGPAPAEAFLEAPDPWLFGPPRAGDGRLTFPVLARPPSPVRGQARLTSGSMWASEEALLPLDPGTAPR